MLRHLLRLFRHSHQQPSLIDPAADRVILYAHLESPPESRRRPARLPAKSSRVVQPTRISHRQRLLAMCLEHTKLCSPKRCDRFRELGIITAGDLACARPEFLARHFVARQKALQVIKQYRRAIRFAAAVPGMMPRDAMLLISIHRRSVRVLAGESPGALHRDLERFAQSTTGRRQLRGRRIPSTRRLKKWIAECKAHSMHAPPLQARAA